MCSARTVRARGDGSDFVACERRASVRAWTSVVGCAQANSPRVNRIAAGATIPFTLAPTSSADPNKWGRGMYRVAVAYSANLDATTDGQLAFSAGFPIS